MTGSTGKHVDNDGAAAARMAGGPGDTGQLDRPAFLAVWFGLLAWAGEYGILAFRAYVLNHEKVLYAESLWLAALTYPLVFGVIGLGLGRLTRGAGARRRSHIVLGIPIALAVMSILLALNALHRVAVLVLAAGIGYRLATLMTNRPTGSRRLVRATFPVLATVTAVSAIVAFSVDPIRERSARAALPDADPAAPNLLFFILDTVRARELSVYGYDRPTTPALESFAAGATTFDLAMSTAPWTLPSHFSMFTGLNTHELPADLEDDPRNALPQQPFLAEILARNGYATAGFVANMSYLTDEFGLDRGFARWYDHRPTVGQWVISTSIGRMIATNGRWRRWLDYHDYPIRKHAARLNAHLLEWLDRDRDRPFFAFVNYFDTHVPYVPPPEFERPFVEERPRLPYYYLPHATRWMSKRGHSAQEYRAQQDMYDATIAYLDHEIGLLLEELGRRGLLDNTLVVIASDHGEAFGEHGMLGHGGAPHIELIHVPLMISFPGRVPAGIRIADAVTLADLPATMLDLLGIEDDRLPGRSLASLWSSPEPAVPASGILSKENPGEDKAESILLDGYQLIRMPNRLELYDIGDDPHARRNLAENPAFAGIRTRLEAALDSLIDRPVSARY